MNERSRNRTRGWIAWPCGLVLLLGVYLLSAGPWSFFQRKGVLPAPIESGVMMMYTPLRLLNQRTSIFRDNPLGRSYREYVEWWEDLARDS